MTHCLIQEVESQFTQNQMTDVILICSWGDCNVCVGGVFAWYYKQHKSVNCSWSLKVKTYLFLQELQGVNQVFRKSDYPVLSEYFTLTRIMFNSYKSSSSDVKANTCLGHLLKGRCGVLLWMNKSNLYALCVSLTANTCVECISYLIKHLQRW